MARVLQLRRGTTAENNLFTGAVGEATYDTTHKELRVHDGSTVGGKIVSAPVGMISPFGGSTAPDGWLVCDGSAVSRTDYADLFAVVGTTYGAGDGSTTFNLPDCNGRVPIYDRTATLGDTTNGKAPNIKGHIPCPRLAAYGDWTGVFYADVSGSTLATGGWSSNGGTMDASRASQVYDDNASKITPAGVYTLICIKY